MPKFETRGQLLNYIKERTMRDQKEIENKYKIDNKLIEIKKIYKKRKRLGLFSYPTPLAIGDDSSNIQKKSKIN